MRSSISLSLEALSLGSAWRGGLMPSEMSLSMQWARRGNGGGYPSTHFADGNTEAIVYSLRT